MVGRVSSILKSMAVFINWTCHSQLKPFFTSQHRLILNPGGAISSSFLRRCASSGSTFRDPTGSKFSTQKTLRRSGNYEPPDWDYEMLLSLRNEYATDKFIQGPSYIERSSVLKEQIRIMLDEEQKPLFQLELIDNLQRLGISYHFEDKIQSVLRRIYNENNSHIRSLKKELYETALEFRLLRQHHFHVPQEVFDCFKCRNGNFNSGLREDTRGMLYLFEASYLSTENESTLELAREFTTKNLKKNLEEKGLDPELTALVQHALELPLHWRMLRLEAWWFLQVYEKKTDMNPNILEFAKLDFNIVQATHQKDLEYALWWWKSTGFAEKFRFARDRLMENFFWTIGVRFDPEYGYFRRMSTKVNALITTIDDIYDVYGTLDELELFTGAVERWDVKAIDQLPGYMKICYLALYNSVNEIAYVVLTEQGVNIIPHLRKTWRDIFRAYLQEAQWYFSGYTPTLQEYLNNAWISISAPVILVHAYFIDSNPIKDAALECLDKYHNIIRCSAMILRLTNDLGTSSDELKRGDVPKSIQCYMKETGASEEEAREYIRLLISQTWNDINKERVRESPFSQRFIAIAMNLSRMAQCMYQNGDGHGHQDSITKDRIFTLLFKSIPLTKT